MEEEPEDWSWLAQEYEAAAHQPDGDEPPQTELPLRLLDLPEPVLLRISSYLSERDLDRFSNTCSQTRRVLQCNKILLGVCRNLSALTKRARDFRHFRHSPCHVLWLQLASCVYKERPDVLSMALSIDPGLQPAEALRNARAAHYLLISGGLRNDGRAADWLLGMSDPGKAYNLRYAQMTRYDEAWALAAGAAAAGNAVSLLAALQAMPTAPGQRQGLRRAHSDFQARTLLAAITRTDPSAALDMVMPLCWLPYKDPSSLDVRDWPWDGEGTADLDVQIQAKRESVQSSLTRVAWVALGTGLVTALPALAARGVDLERLFLAFAPVCETPENAAALTALLNLPGLGDGADALKDTINDDILRVAWKQAMHAGRLHCLLAFMDTCFESLRHRLCTDVYSLARSREPARLHLLRALLAHITADQWSVLHQDQGLLLMAVREGRTEIVSLLLQYDYEPTGECIEAAVCPEVLRMLLDAAVAKGPSLAASELSREQLVKWVYERASEYDSDRAGKAMQLRCARLFLAHILQQPGVHPSLPEAYFRYKCQNSDPDLLPAEGDRHEHGLWDRTDMSNVDLHVKLLHTLLILDEPRVLHAALQLFSHVLWNQKLLQRIAHHFARHSGPAPPPLLLNIADGKLPDLLLALCRAAQPQLALSLLKHSIKHSHYREPRPWGVPRQIDRLPGAPGLASLSASWPQHSDGTIKQVIATAAEHYGDTGCDVSLTLLRVMLVGGPHDPTPALLLPKGASQYRTRHHYRLLKFLLELVGARALGLCHEGAGMDASSPALPAEIIARFAPVPFVTLLVAHRVPAEPLLCGLSQRATPPVALITQLLEAQPVGLSRAVRPTPLPRAQHVNNAPRPDVEWAGGRMLYSAAASGNADVAELLLAAGAREVNAALHNPQSAAKIVMRILQATGTVPRGPLGDAVCVSVLTGCDEPEEAVRQLLALGVGSEEVMVAAATAGSVVAMEYILRTTEEDLSLLLDNAIIQAAQHNRREMVVWLTERGASVHCALHGAVLGRQKALVVWLRQQGADPSFDGGAALTAAFDSGNQELINLLLPED